MLAHTAYFEALASIEDETNPEWKSILAGLVVLRLIDSWLDLGAQVVTTDVTGLQAVRDAVAAVSEGDPIQSILVRLLDTLEQTETADIRAISPHWIAYGKALHYAGQWQLATDVFTSIRERAKVACDSTLMIEATLQVGKNLKAIGNFSESDEVYLSAISEAEAIGDINSSIRAQLGRVQIVVTRGDLPTAEKVLDALAAKASSCGLMEMYGQVLHSRADLAFMQGNYSLSVRSAYQALEHTTDAIARDRILVIIAVSFAQLGHLLASRDANLIIASTAQEQEVRWYALINLMYVAILEGHEVAFEQYRSALADVPLTPRTEAHYRVDAGRGFIKFGRMDLARRELSRARYLAEHYTINQLTFEIDAVLAEQAATLSESEGLPQSWPADIATIASTLSEWRELQDAAMSHVGGET